MGRYLLSEDEYSQYVNIKARVKELEDYARRQENQRETYYKEFLKRDKALEECEGLISDDEFIRCPINDDVNCNYFTRNKILDIINKAKGEEKCQ